MEQELKDMESKKIELRNVRSGATGVQVTDEAYFRQWILDLADEIVDIDIMFLKGHASPVNPPGDSDEDTSSCEQHCDLKIFLFEKIAAIERCENDTEKILNYVHACEDLLIAVGEIQERLDELLMA